MSNIYDALTKANKPPNPIGSLSVSLRAMSLEWKIMLLVLGLLFVVILNQLIGRALRTQMDENAVLMATNLSDAAAGYLASKDVLKLQTTVTKYARLNRVAYAFVRDREGKVIAHSLATSSPESQEELTSDQRRQVSRRELTWQGKPVYETREPILDGQLGTAHIGIWTKAVEREIYRTLFMFVWPITFGAFAIVIMMLMWARPLIRALHRQLNSRAGPAQATSTNPLA
jgi:sensor histidine kinase regulating citrate/malate metabolism